MTWSRKRKKKKRPHLLYIVKVSMLYSNNHAYYLILSMKVLYLQLHSTDYYLIQLDSMERIVVVVLRMQQHISWPKIIPYH